MKRMNPILNLAQTLSLGLILMAISSEAIAGNLNIKREYPKSKEDQVRNDMGSIFGEDGLVLKSGHATKNIKKHKKKVAEAREYLWEAARAVLKTMPTSYADFSSGTIITDWYVSRFQPNYSLKVEVNINDASLSRPETIDVKVHERKLDKGQWYNEPENEVLVAQYRKNILAKARELHAKDNTKVHGKKKHSGQDASKNISSDQMDSSATNSNKDSQ